MLLRMILTCWGPEYKIPFAPKDWYNRLLREWLCSSAGLERSIHNAEVDGSSPSIATSSWLEIPTFTGK